MLVHIKGNIKLARVKFRPFSLFSHSLCVLMSQTDVCIMLSPGGMNSDSREMLFSIPFSLMRECGSRYGLSKERST